jgi:hypothetical protein
MSCTSTHTHTAPAGAPQEAAHRCATSQPTDRPHTPHPRGPSEGRGPASPNPPYTASPEQRASIAQPQRLTCSGLCMRHTSIEQPPRQAVRTAARARPRTPPQAAQRADGRAPQESLRSMTPDSDSPAFWRVRVMTLEKLESQSHDSERVGDSAVFMGVVTLGEPDFRHFQPETALFPGG